MVTGTFKGKVTRKVGIFAATFIMEAPEHLWVGRAVVN